MCGIAGVWLRNGKHVGPETLSRMLTTLHHRGPDGDGRWCEDDIGFGHTRLRIVDLSPSSRQPMRDAAHRFVLTYNGEIHNYLELRAELRDLGHEFRTSGDTEVVLAALKQWGVSAFERFNGMWALAWWDAEEKRLILSRDRFGIKPLYYSVWRDRIAFASEPKAILAAFPRERQPNHEEIHTYLQGGAPDVGQDTFFANIRRVEPATYIDFRPRGEAVSRKYWALTTAPNHDSFEDNSAHFRHLLQDAVRLRLRSDAPVGAALSGGLDSSAVVGLAAAEGARPKCYSLRYPGAAHDESSYAATVAEAARCSVQWVEPDGARAIDLVNDIVWHHDAPPPIRGRLPHWAIMRYASRDVTVMLEGTGADELLAGYGYMATPYLFDRLRDIAVRRRWRDLPGLARELRQLNRVNSESRSFTTALLRQAVQGILRRSPWKQVETQDFRSQFGPLSPNRRRGAWRSADAPPQSNLDRTLWLEMTGAGLAESLHGADAASMAHSVEARPPFLDHRLVEFCFTLPFEHKIRDGWTKSVLRNALSGTIPDSVLTRRAKFGFPAPYGEWLSSESSYESICDILFSSRSTARGILDTDKLKFLLSAGGGRGQAYIRRYVELVWRILSLELWFHKFIDCLPVPPVARERAGIGQF